MKPTFPLSALGIHAALLVLASTRFTVLTQIGDVRQWTFNYFQYSYRDGWGYTYHSDYSLAVVLTYLAAYGVGIVAYATARRFCRTRWIYLGLLLCTLGAVSFSIEASHWLWDHHLCWIATCLAASLLLAGVVAFRLWRTTDKVTQSLPPQFGSDPGEESAAL